MRKQLYTHHLVRHELHNISFLDIQVIFWVGNYNQSRRVSIARIPGSYGMGHRMAWVRPRGYRPSAPVVIARLIIIWANILWHLRWAPVFYNFNRGKVVIIVKFLPQHDLGRTPEFWLMLTLARLVNIFGGTHCENDPGDEGTQLLGGQEHSLHYCTQLTKSLVKIRKISPL